MPKTRGDLKIVLVLGDTFSRWVKAYTTRTEKMTEVTKLILKEIIPQKTKASKIYPETLKLRTI